MTTKQASPSKLDIDIQFASAVIKEKVLTIASLTAIKKWVKAAIQLNGLITLRFVNAAEGKKLNFDFNLASQKEFLLPRQRYGIDLYGVHNGKWNACARRSRIGSSSHAASRMSYVWIMPQSSCNELFGKYVNT